MSEGNNQVDPARLSIEQASKLLSAAYRERIDVVKIQKDKIRALRRIATEQSAL